MHHQTVLITGASSGIGLALAHRFAKNGYTLVLVARSEARLEIAKRALDHSGASAVHTIAADLVLPESIEKINTYLKEHDLKIDCLVNNAGVGQYGAFKDQTEQNDITMIELNIAALVRLTRLVLSGMVGRSHGKIMNIASLAAFQPGPFMATYYASKAFVLSFSEALHEELRGSGVTVTAVCPGPTKTNFDLAGGAVGSALFAEGKGLMTADAVADIAYRATLQGKRVVVPGVKNRILAFLPRITPRGIVLKVVKYMQRPAKTR